jgi:hypothetical protein
MSRRGKRERSPDMARPRCRRDGIAQVTVDKDEQAYRRSDTLEKRRKLMDAWSAYCEPRQADKVIRLTRNSARRSSLVS